MAHTGDGEEHEREHQVHERAAEHDDDPLATGRCVEQRGRRRRAGPPRSDCARASAIRLRNGPVDAARRVVRPTLRRREHPDHADVAAERDRLDAVLGLARRAATRPCGPKPTMYWVHLDAELLGRRRGGRSRAGDRDQQADDEDDACRGRSSEPSCSAPPMPTRRPVPRPGAGPGLRAQDVRRRSVGFRVEPVRRCSSTHRGDGVDDPEERQPRRRGTPRRTPRWPRCRPPARVPPGCRRGAPARRPGTPRRRAARTPSVGAVVQSTGGRGVRHPVGPGQAQRDRQPHVRRAGLRDRRAVDELDHRVHDRLRVHDDVDAVEAGRRTAGAPRSPRGPC